MTTKFKLALAFAALVTRRRSLAPGPRREAATAAMDPLFDGKILNGWRGYKKPDAPRRAGRSRTGC
jgi:hypothetical protein